jgi:hypothetical protein
MPPSSPPGRRAHDRPSSTPTSRRRLPSSPAATSKTSPSSRRPTRPRRCSDDDPAISRARGRGHRSGRAGAAPRPCQRRHDRWQPARLIREPCRCQPPEQQLFGGQALRCDQLLIGGSGAPASPALSPSPSRRGSSARSRQPATRSNSCVLSRREVVSATDEDAEHLRRQDA